MQKIFEDDCLGNIIQDFNFFFQRNRQRALCTLATDDFGRRAFAKSVDDPFWNGGLPQGVMF